MFQPVLNNIGPALVAQARENEANRNAETERLKTAAVVGAVNKATDAVSGAISTWAADGAQQQSNAGTLAAMTSINEHAKANGGKPIVDDVFLQSIGKMKTAEATAAMKATLPVFDSYLSMNRQIAVQNAAPGANFTPKVVDAGNGVQMVMTSPRSAQVVSGDKATNGRVVQTAGGYTLVDPKTGTTQVLTGTDGQPLMPVPKGNNMNAVDLANQAKGAQLDADIAKLQGEIAGGNQQSGFDWLPSWAVGGSYADQLRKKQAERASLGSGGAPAAPAAGGGGIPEGATATNPQTGAKMVYRNGAWQNL